MPREPAAQSLQRILQHRTLDPTGREIDDLVAPAMEQADLHSPPVHGHRQLGPIEVIPARGRRQAGLDPLDGELGIGLDYRNVANVFRQGSTNAPEISLERAKIYAGAATVGVEGQGNLGFKI